MQTGLLPRDHVLCLPTTALMIQKSTSYVLNYRKTLRKDLSGYNGSHQVTAVVSGKLEDMNIFPQYTKKNQKRDTWVFLVYSWE